MANKELEDITVENTFLKRELCRLEKRLEKMQSMFAKQHEEIRILRIKAGAKRIGPYKIDIIQKVNTVDKSNNI